MSYIILSPYDPWPCHDSGEIPVSSEPLHVRFVVEKVAFGEAFLRVIYFSPVNRIPSMLCANLHIYAASNSGTQRRSLGKVTHSNACLEIRNIGKTAFAFSSFLAPKD